MSWQTEKRLRNVEEAANRALELDRGPEFIFGSVDHIAGTRTLFRMTSSGFEKLGTEPWSRETDGRGTHALQLPHPDMKTGRS